MQTRTVEVKNVSDLASEREVHEFFSFSGEIENIRIQRDNGQSKTAFVTFKDPKALEIALLLSGATIVDQIVAITPVENYVPNREPQEVRNMDIAIHAFPSEDFPSNVEQGKTSPSGSGSVYVSRAQEVVTSMLAKGSAIGQDAMNKAKAFDEKHRLSASASEKVISFDRRVGLTEKLTVGISVVNEKVKSVDERLHVSDKTMAAIFAAERKINDTGSAVKSSSLDQMTLKIEPVPTPLVFFHLLFRRDNGLTLNKMSSLISSSYHQPQPTHHHHLNKYVSAGTAWLNGAFSKVAKAGQVAGTKTRAKFSLAVSNLTAKESPIAV